MLITFLGTSHGVPEANRRCSCTLIEIADKKYIIDAGMDPTPELISRGIHPNEITAIFITHSHSDHMSGLIPFVDLCCWSFTKADPHIFLPEIGMKEIMKAWITGLHDKFRDELRFSEIQEGVIYDDGVLRVTAKKTGHIANAYAFVLEAEGKRVLFTGDMKHGDGPAADYARFTAVEHFDLVVAESAHFDGMQYLEPIRKNPPSRFCFNHYTSDFSESCYHLRSVLKDEVPVTLVTDGYRIRL